MATELTPAPAGAPERAGRPEQPAPTAVAGPADGELARWLARAAAWLVIAALVLGVPSTLPAFHSVRFAGAVIVAIVALSLNVLIGYAGQVSLGHQGFMGVGAFVSGYVASAHGQSFWVAVAAAAVVAAGASLLLGVVALRVQGLYLALVTLAFGLVAQNSIFSLPLFGSGAGVEAPRPAGFAGEDAYLYLCLAFLAGIWYLDWRFTRSKAGRAVNALRESEQVAASYGIPVARYKLLAFIVAGAFVGVAGSLFAHLTGRVDPADFQFTDALLFVIIAVVGGLRSRPGVVVWAVTFTLVPVYLGDIEGGLGETAPFLSLALGAVLLVVILVFRPGGVGELIRPVTNWLAGGPLSRGEGHLAAEGREGRP